MHQLRRALAAACDGEARFGAAVALWRGRHLGRGWRCWLHHAARTTHPNPNPDPHPHPTPLNLISTPTLTLSPSPALALTLSRRAAPTTDARRCSRPGTSRAAWGAPCSARGGSTAPRARACGRAALRPSASRASAGCSRGCSPSPPRRRARAGARRCSSPRTRHACSSAQPVAPAPAPAPARAPALALGVGATPSPHTFLRWSASLACWYACSRAWICGGRGEG